MAGGRGTRFYPVSTEDKPKQFLNLVGEKTMIQMTVDRLKKIMSVDQIFIATGEKYTDLVKEQLPEIPNDNILIEPVGRNTAPCVVFGALNIQKKFPHANMVVLPSDALITDVDEFVNVLKTANSFLEHEKQSVVTIGIKPTRPETGYGYIKQLDQYKEISNYKVYKVERFVEKPDIERAKKYLKEGNYLWNAGIFVWNVDYVQKLAQQYMIATYNNLIKIVNSSADEFNKNLNELYAKCESISIDYAIMEKINTINVVPGDFGWDDIGTWNALERYLPKDDYDNINNGNAYIENSKNNIIFSSGKKVVLLGVEDLYCLESDDLIVIGKKDDLKNVHKLKEKKW